MGLLMHRFRKKWIKTAVSENKRVESGRTTIPEGLLTTETDVLPKPEVIMLNTEAALVDLREPEPFLPAGLGETTLFTRGYQSTFVTDTVDDSITGCATVKVKHVRHHHDEIRDIPVGPEAASVDRFFGSPQETSDCRCYQAEVGWRLAT
jgi:hypothetical protein